MHLTPLSNHVIVVRDDADKVSKGGIILPDSARKEKPSRGEVLAVGPGKLVLSQAGEWKHEPMHVSVGQTVLFSTYGGADVEVDGEKVVVLTENDIMAIIGGGK